MLRVKQARVDELANDPANARKHDERSIESIKASLLRFGQQKPIVVDENNVVRAGNGTLEAARQLGWSKIAVVMTDLRGDELKAFAIADNRTADLSYWDPEQLLEQLNELSSLNDEELLRSVSFTEKEIFDLINEDDADAGLGVSEKYTRKIAVPIYEPRGERPELSEIVDRSRVEALMAEIDGAAGVSDAEKEFLRHAAERHAVFNYEMIADYYANASPECQRLMEASALVLIDFDQAIERGYTALADEISELYMKDHGNASE